MTSARAPIDAVLFDLDGTLIDSKVDIARCVNFTLRDLALPERSLEEVFSFVGDGIKALLRLSVGEGNHERYEEALRVFRGHYLAHCLDTTRLYPGILEVLDAVRGRPAAIVTNKSLEYARKIVEGLDAAKHFVAIEGPRDTSELKPAPGMLERVLSGLHIAPSRAVLIGDSTNDVRAAQAIGAQACAVGYGYGNREKVLALAPDFYCEQPHDLLAVVAQGVPEDTAPSMRDSP